MNTQEGIPTEVIHGTLSRIGLIRVSLIRVSRTERHNTGDAKRYTDCVPTVHREGPYRFFFYSADRNEPPHVHAERDANRAKFWLQPVRLAWSGGFGAAELKQLERLVIVREQLFVRAWNEYFTVPD